MRKRTVNPWRWQDAVGYSQAVEVAEAGRTLYLSGQAAMDAEGNPSDADMAGQVAQAMDNVEAVLREASYALGDVVRLNVYTTSAAELMPQFPAIKARFAGAAPPSCTVLEVAGLAFPSLRVEIEATATR